MTGRIVLNLFSYYFSISSPQYTSDLEEKIDNFTLNLAPLNLMSTIAMKVLQEYNKSGVDEIPFNNILQQVGYYKYFSTDTNLA